MRRAARLLTALLLAAVVLLPATAATATPDALVLAVEAEDGPPPGPDPRDASDEENEFAPAQYEANFLWGAGVGLLGGVLAVLGLGGAFYYYRVVKPTQPQRR